MDADLEKKLTDIGIPKSKIDDIAKKKKYIERIKYVLEQGNITTADKETGNLIILVAEKVNPAFNHRIPLLLKYVNSKEITSSHQLDACVEYLRKKGDEELNEEDFKKQCGIGVKITEELPDVFASICSPL